MKDNELNDESPYDRAGFISKATFWWLNSLFRKGYKEGLTLEDVSHCPKQDKSDYLLQRIDRCWQPQISRYKEENGASLFFTVIKAFRSEFFLPGLAMFLCEACRVSQPYIIGQLILHFEDENIVSTTQAYIYAVILALLLTCAVLLDLFHFYKVQHLSLKMKTAVGALIYKKILSLNSQTFHLTNSGQILNLLTTDLEKFNFSFETSHFLWICPLELVVIMILLYHHVGFPALFTLGVIAILLPLQIFCGQMFARLRGKIGKWSDKRINKMNEILSGIRVIKMYCWEKPFHSVITRIRKKEVKFVKIAVFLRALNLALMAISPKLMGLIIFISLWWLGLPISVHIVFVTVGWLLILQDTVFLFLFLAVENLMALYVSLKRVQSFLLIDEEKSMRTFKDVKQEPSNNESEISIDIMRMTARWHINPEYNESRYSRMVESEQLLFETEMEKYFSLRNINLSVKKGELLAVVGKVGSGKTSLLMTLMGEIQHNKGEITVYGDISYSCQQSWVFSGSLKDNILLGNEYRERKYREVLRSCALVKDIDKMTNRDSTYVGERGLFLSGGQKARLTLARAVYGESDIYLLDDPLSSVDSEVGQHIFHQCVKGLLKDKTRILVTHQVQYLKQADRILILNEGTIKHIGTYQDLLSQGVDFTNVLTQENEEDQSPVKEVGTVETTELSNVAVEEEVEELNRNKVPFKVYKDYFKAGYFFYLLPLWLIIMVLHKPSQFVADWNLAKWAQSYDDVADVYLNTSLPVILFNTTGNIIQYTSNNNSNDDSTHLFNNRPEDRTLTPELKFYFIFISLFAVFGFIFILLNMLICAVASQNLHNKMFERVLGGVTRFFDSQPLGRILNRFSRDIGLMDDILIRIWEILLEFTVLLIGTCINICIIAPWLFITLLPLCCVIIAIRFYAIKTTRDVKRLEAIAKSPVYCHVSDTIIGLQTIRASGKQKQFAEEFNMFQNQASGAWFTYLSAYRWFSIRTLICVIIFINLVIHVFLLIKDDIPSGLVGLAFTYLISFSMPFEFFMRISAELENSMTAVERVLSYTNVEQEASKTSDRPPPNDWPSQGSITFSDINLKYDKDGPLILKNINLHIKSKEKIGIVGRTGAGKSSLMATLFRLAEPNGKIFIDGWDVLLIGLDELRKKISVIPQDPVLFSGTLRYNLDPFDEYSDERLWNALDQVQLREKVAKTPDNLYMEMSEAGQNFSVGQRQLVCLARALLRYNTILVLDEATAHVDSQTDELIQGTIRAKFLDSTVLTIAHRLHTVMDCDRILVLSDGEVKEFDTPFNLLLDDEGYFTNLVDQTGPHQSAELRQMAKLANQSRLSASILLEEAVLKADRHLSNSRCSLSKSIKSRNSISRKDSQKRNRPDLDRDSKSSKQNSPAPVKSNDTKSISIKNSENLIQNGSAPASFSTSMDKHSSVENLQQDSIQSQPSLHSLTDSKSFKSSDNVDAKSEKEVMV